jgi:hypothetical protein
VKYFLVFLLLIIGPVVISAANYLMGERRGNWQTADRSSAGLLPNASEHPDALIRVYAARTVRWRGIFAVHSWIIVKEREASHYTRYHPKWLAQTCWSLDQAKDDNRRMLETYQLSP